MVLQWVIHFQNLIVYVEIHILHQEHLRETARESCPVEDRRGFEDGLLTKHWRGLALITRSKPKQKQEGRRNVTTLGNMHWQLMLLLRLDVSSTIVGSCPRTSTIGASALETAGCGRWNCCLKIKTGHYHPSSFLLLFFSRMTVASRGIFDNVFLALAQKVALIIAFGFQNGCLLLSVCSLYPCPKDMIADCELLESIISPLTAIKRKTKINLSEFWHIFLIDVNEMKGMADFCDLCRITVFHVLHEWVCHSCKNGNWHHSAL